MMKKELFGMILIFLLIYGLGTIGEYLVEKVGVGYTIGVFTTIIIYRIDKNIFS